MDSSRSFFGRLFQGRDYRGPAIDVAGLSFPNPFGIQVTEDEGLDSLARSCAGFLNVKPGKKGSRKLLDTFPQRGPVTLLSVELEEDISRSFSLAYDFVDFVVLSPDTHTGLESLEVSDVTSLIDEVLNLRLCYEAYTPVFVRLSPARTMEELESLVHFCLLNGIDGFFVNSRKHFDTVKSMLGNRLPLGVTLENATPEELLAMYKDGASLVESNLNPIGLGKALRLLEKEGIRQ